MCGLLCGDVHVDVCGAEYMLMCACVCVLMCVEEGGEKRGVVVCAMKCGVLLRVCCEMRVHRNVPVCTFKTLPCVPSNVRMFETRGRL